MNPRIFPLFPASRRMLLMALIFSATAASLPALTPAQPELPKIVLTIGDARIEAEVADDPDEKTIGLMGRKELADGQGMLFVFSRPQALGFWMKDTLIPLSIAYINAQGIIREIHDMQPLAEDSVPSLFGDLVYALEVPQGWFTQKGILAGDKVTGLPKPSNSD
ncbi:MAG: DUF192 domain-containing protein [Chthoniobacterales bacterium]|jgi:uncharacterized membrane protein (UPF0127 family)